MDIPGVTETTYHIAELSMSLYEVIFIIITKPVIVLASLNEDTWVIDKSYMHE